MDDLLKTNRARWDEVVPIHAQSAFYDLEGFRRGRINLDEYEVEGAGVVEGKSLLHLQCHFGLSSLAFARLGARVVGIDFSAKAVDLARELATEQQLDARFICSDLYDLPNHLDEEFDVVFTSYGVLTWLPDLGRWAEIVARYLKPGGRFFIIEFHPFAAVFDDTAERTLRVHYPYFAQPQPLRFEEPTTYTGDNQIKIKNQTSYEWCHSFSDIVGSLLAAGLRIEDLREYDRICYKALPLLEEEEAGWWRLPAELGSIPLMFSLRATI